MQPEVIQTLLELNGQFYQTFGSAFAATRLRIQNGVNRILASQPVCGDWLDLGCGSGAVAAAWAAIPGRSGAYTGMDFSSVLLAEAQKAVDGLQNEEVWIDFMQADLCAPDWAVALGDRRFDRVVAFAVLHHIPGRSVRERLLKQVHSLLQPDGCFIHSVWQFQHSPRLMERRQPWETIGLTAEMLEEGDTLLDWRYALPGQLEESGLRYVHLFDQEELQSLAAACGFEVYETFESDGAGGRLGLYQVWRKIQPESI